jgi:lysophospholipase L1-like esterase
LRDATRHAPRLVQPLQPRLVVLYSGDNDLANGRTPAQVEADFAAFVKAVRAHDRAVKVAVISIKPSPARAALLPAMRDANARLQRVANTTPGVAFIDVFTPMLGDDGKPRRELFIDDELHLSADGYRLWTKQIAPFLAPPG